MDNLKKRPASKLPKAIVIGAPKAGTTTLCAALARHPDIYMYPKKETHFFNDHYEGRGIDWYGGLFQDAPDGALVMEGTPDYAMSHCVDAAMRRIAAHIPEVRLIYAVREPVARVESHYIQQVSNTRKAIPIEDAIKRWPEIVDTSDYGATMSVIHRYHDPANVLVVFLDDYAAHRDREHRRILDFLGVSSSDQSLAVMSEQEVLHRRENQGMDGALLARLRRLRYYDRLNMAMPAPIIRLGKKLLRRKIDISSALSKDDRQALQQRFNGPWREFQAQYRVRIEAVAD